MRLFEDWVSSAQVMGGISRAVQHVTLGSVSGPGQVSEAAEFLVLASEMSLGDAGQWVDKELMSSAIWWCVAETGLNAATPGSVMEPRATELVAELGRNEGLNPAFLSLIQWTQVMKAPIPKGNVYTVCISNTPHSSPPFPRSSPSVDFLECFLFPPGPDPTLWLILGGKYHLFYPDDEH